MKQQLIYTALFTFALGATAPMALAGGDKHDDHTMTEQRQDSGAYNATGANGDAPPTSPAHPSGPEGAGTGSGTGTGTGGAGGGGTGTGTGGGAGTGTSGGSGSTGAGTGGAGSGGASGAGAGAGG